MVGQRACASRGRVTSVRAQPQSAGGNGYHLIRPRIAAHPGNPQRFRRSPVPREAQACREGGTDEGRTFRGIGGGALPRLAKSLHLCYPMPMTTPLGALVIARPAEAADLIISAIVEAQGNRSHAARGPIMTTANAGKPVPLRTLHNWISRLQLWPRIDAVCSEHGFAIQPGPERRV